MVGKTGFHWKVGLDLRQGGGKGVNGMQSGVRRWEGCYSLDLKSIGFAGVGKFVDVMDSPSQTINHSQAFRPPHTI